VRSENLHVFVVLVRNIIDREKAQGIPPRLKGGRAVSLLTALPWSIPGEQNDDRARSFVQRPSLDAAVGPALSKRTLDRAHGVYDDGESIA
jgi:hypothetical protein